MLKSSQFHGYFCVGFVECPLLQNASKLLRSSPNFGQLPQKKSLSEQGLQANMICFFMKRLDQEQSGHIRVMHIHPAGCGIARVGASPWSKNDNPFSVS